MQEVSETCREEQGRSTRQKTQEGGYTPAYGVFLRGTGNCPLDYQVRSLADFQHLCRVILGRSMLRAGRTLLFS